MPQSAGRFAPSPTGHLHVGNLRTALAAWLFARADNSPFWLRFEDLDSNAVRHEYYESQQQDLSSLGLDWDGEPVLQSQRDNLYRDAISRLVDRAETYECYCSRKEIRTAAQAPNGGMATLSRYPGTCRQLTSLQRQAKRDAGRPPAIRLRGTADTVVATDELCGEVSGDFADLVIVRNDGTPAYNLVVVVDDADQGVELVVRADDLLDSTPAHIGLAHLLGLTPPRYAHVPLVVGADGFRLTKQEGAVTLGERVALGETPAIVLGFLAESLGLIDELEPIETAADLIDRFNPRDLPKLPLQLPADYLLKDQL
jgi:glutamyl-tRNA synthetase